MSADPQPGEYWRICADPRGEGTVVEVVEKTTGHSIVDGEELYRIILVPGSRFSQPDPYPYPRSWLRERVTNKP